MRAALCALTLALALWPLAARSDDYGPRHDVAAIRHDLPILLSRDLDAHNTSPSAVRIDGVALSGDLAIVQWHADQQSGIAGMQLRFGRWWLNQRAAVDAPIDYAGYGCGGLGAPFQALVPLAQHHLPAIDAMLAQRARTPKNQPIAIPDCPTVIYARFPRPTLLGAPYEATIAFAKTDLYPETSAAFEDLRGRAPSEAESWANPPSGNSYFFFSGTVQAQQPVHVQAGTTIDVWFPFVLDTSLRYSLTIAAPNAMSLGPIDGTLEDNTLHLVLPAFTASPGSELMGEVEGN